MKERISRRALELRVEWLTKALGRPKHCWTKRADGKGCECAVGAFNLDHQARGWQIEEMDTPGGGIHHPFGSQRMSALETLHVLDAALAGIEMARKGGAK